MLLVPLCSNNFVSIVFSWKKTKLKLSRQNFFTCSSQTQERKQFRSLSIKVTDPSSVPKFRHFYPFVQIRATAQHGSDKDLHSLREALQEYKQNEELAAKCCPAGADDHQEVKLGAGERKYRRLYSQSQKQQKMERRLNVNNEKFSFLEALHQKNQNQSAKRYWSQEFKQVTALWKGNKVAETWEKEAKEIGYFWRVGGSGRTQNSGGL